jgi:hypothetical protein
MYECKILLHTNQLHVSATHMTIFRVTTRILTQFYVHMTLHRSKFFITKPTDALIFFPNLFSQNKFGKKSASVGFVIKVKVTPTTGHKGVPGRFRPRIFLTFGTTRVVCRQPHAPAAFTPRGNPSY